MVTKIAKQRLLVLPAAIGLLSLVAMTTKKEISVESQNSISYETVKPIIEARCLSCHATNNTDDVFKEAQKGIILESEKLIREHSLRMLPQLENKVMPLANKTQMTEEERTQLILYLKSL